MSERFDAIVVGGGLAGLMTALELRPLRVALVSNRDIGVGTASAWAQGGIAAAVGDDDTPALHAADTIAAGAGLVEQRVAERLAADAPHAIERIIALGVRFDRKAGTRFALGREAAHSRRRILRAGGDATGAELIRAVVEVVLGAPSVVRFEHAQAKEILTHDGSAVGVRIERDDGTVVKLSAPAVVLATGGLGGLYQYTTNPPASRGDGIALAAHAGARLEDLEFVQFHPTALDVPADPLPLLTEALRGEGALLVDASGKRIMDGIDPALELAPRDVVARRVYALRIAGVRTYLDARAIKADLSQRFPTVWAATQKYGIDMSRDPIPVVAAAHYHMGGIAVDLDGRSSVHGLYACGEVAATGVHGANRLASNSLLESVVYPERIAARIKSSVPAATAAPAGDEAGATSVHDDSARERHDREALAPLRKVMYEDVGVEREAAGLERALAFFSTLVHSHDDAVRSAATVAALVATSALRRHESRGSHQRRDFPDVEAAERKHSFVTLADMNA